MTRFFLQLWIASFFENRNQVFVESNKVKFFYKYWLNEDDTNIQTQIQNKQINE
jgi:hypothetical protein